MPTTPTAQLNWISQSVENIMLRNGIENRSQLANKLAISRSVVYESFDESWSGEATGNMLAEMCATFNVPMGQLVFEPALKRREVRSIGHVRQAGFPDRRVARRRVHVGSR